MSEQQVEQLLEEVSKIFIMYNEKYGCNPQYLIMDIDTCLDFEEALNIRLGLPRREFKPGDKAKRTFRGCEIIPAFLNEKRVILA